MPDGWTHSQIDDIAVIQVGRDLVENRYSEAQINKHQYPVGSNTVENPGLYGFYGFPEYSGNSVAVVSRGKREIPDAVVIDRKNKSKGEPMKDNQLTFDTQDEFNRRKNAEQIIRLLTSEVSVSPLVIDGEWGSGKTVFTKKLINLMEKKHTDYLPVYVDAFKADHADNPLMTLLAEVAKTFPKKDQENLIKKSIPAVRFALKTGSKALVSWLLRQDSATLVDGYEKEVKEASDELINLSVEKLLREHIQAEESIETLRTALKEVSKDKNLILFVDELDRCRPNFSVSMLEVIKHIFDVEGIQFVLVTNTWQLQASINHCYGVGLDAARYLNKFIRFRFVLPDTHGEYYYQQNVAESHALNLLNKSRVLEQTILRSNENTITKDLYLRIITSNYMTLREVETFTNYLEIYHTLSGNGSGLNKKAAVGAAMSAIIGVYIYMKESSKIKEILLGEIDTELLCSILGFNDYMLTEADMHSNLNLLTKTLIHVFSSCDKKRKKYPEEAFHQYKSRLFSFSGEFDNTDRVAMLLKLPIMSMTFEPK